MFCVPLFAAFLPAMGTRAAEPPPGREASYVEYNRWEPLKREGQEEYRLLETNVAVHLSLAGWSAPAPDGGAWRGLAWGTARTDVRVLSLPQAQVVTPSYNPSLNAAVSREFAGGRLAGLQLRLANLSNGQSGPPTLPPTPGLQEAAPGVVINEHDGRFTTDDWRLSLFGRIPPWTLTLAWQHEIDGPDGAPFGPLGPDLRALYPAARASAELAWRGRGPGGRWTLRGWLEGTFQGAYASFHRHYPNGLLEAAVFPAAPAAPLRPGAFVRYQAGYDDYNILFTTKRHEVVAGLVWEPPAP